tara:strand:+ start:1724 stop:2044 length:321 start_codon:yes stop_codon:yes gene_type:complete
MRKYKKINKKSYFNYYIFSVVGIFLIIMLVFNDFGFLRYLKLKKEYISLDKELQILLLQQNTLRSEIDQLQTNQDYIEKIAREKFMMVKPGERVYRVKEEKKIDKN